MPEGRIRYWFNRDTRLIHKSSCPNCLMSYNGHEKESWAAGGIRGNWWGPYETLGAAIDVATVSRSTVNLCARGCGSWPSIDSP